MSDEIKEEKKECKCSKELKMFLLTILGSFLGCLVALCLFTAAVKPQTQPPHPAPCPRVEAPRLPHDISIRKEFRHDVVRPDNARPDFRGERPNQKPPVKPEQKK